MNALERLGGEETFLALNGDILTDLTAMVARHRERGADATIALTWRTPGRSGSCRPVTTGA